MSTKEKVKAAYRAMKAIGIGEEQTKPALKKLLKVFNKDWTLIELENYRVLADAIFEFQEETAEKEKKSENAERGEPSEMAAGMDGHMPDESIPEEPERPLKRLRLKHQGQGPSSNGQHSPTPALKVPKPEPGEPVSPQPLVRNKGKQPMSSKNSEGSREREKGGVTERPAKGLQLKEPKPEPGTAPSAKQKLPQTNGLIKPKDEPFTDDVVSIEPLAVILPECVNKEAPSNPANQVISENGERHETMDGVEKDIGSMAATEQEKEAQEVDVNNKAFAKFDIAASTLGEVKMYMSCNTGSKAQKMCIPDLEAVLEKVTEDCVKEFNITEPGFSLSDILRQICDGYSVELSKKANGAVDDSRGQD